MEHEIADPYVLKWNGEYYLYTSGDPITAYQSTDLIHRSSIGPVLQSSSKPEAWNQADVWAPEVVYRNGKFYMYYTASRKSDEQSGTWLVEEGALHQVAGGPSRSVALKGDSADNYEFTASVLWRDNDSLTSRVGVVAAAQSNNELVLAGFDKSIWPFAHFWVQHVMDGNIRDSFSVGLPRGFQYEVYHTIRVIKQGRAFTFFLDGKEIAAARFSIGPAQPGVFTEGARAAFDDAAMKYLVVPQNLVLNSGFETEQWGGIHATKDNPWALSGGARPNDCCAHSGLRRLIISGGQGSAKQVIAGLTPGSYTLHAWVLSTNGSEPQLSVSDFGGSAVRTAAGGEQWHRVSLDFSIPDGQAAATIHFDAGVSSGSSGYAAADDFYLFKQ